MTKYQFDISQPYILHRSKTKSYFWFCVAAIGLIGGLLSRDFIMLGIILSVVFMFIGFNGLKKKDKMMRIDQRGITPFGENTILWRQINRCFYETTSAAEAWNVEYYLKIILKNKDSISICLNDYSYDGKKLGAAIDFYAGRKLFGQTKRDQKEELKDLLISFIVVVAISVFFILMITLAQK